MAQSPEKNLSEGRVYRYSWTASFIPLVLALEIALMGFLFYVYPPSGYRDEGAVALPFFVQLRLMVFGVALILAGWILRFYFQLRSTFRLTEGSLLVRTGSHERAVSFNSIESIDYENMLGPSRKLFGAIVLRSKPSTTIRIYNVLKDGGSFIQEFSARINAEPLNRRDLQGWIDALGLDKKMRRAKLYTRLWYYPMAFVFLAFIVRGYFY